VEQEQEENKVTVAKPIVPPFVAEWIEKHRGEKLFLAASIPFAYEENDDLDKKVNEWLINKSNSKDSVPNDEKFLRAWLDG
ncbi:DUF1642 domain-containing protein, partial [Salmonella enterica]|uniref:DUF1642 domain-containing protein n=1 Tax=Salmonella enterica TaxID=28901 RepID=UPI000CA91D7F